MNAQKTNGCASRLSGLVPVASAAIILFGCAELLRWILNYPALQIVQHLPRVMPNTAVGFILAGLFLWFQQGDTGKRRWQRTAGKLAAGLVFLIGFLTLLEYALDWNVGFDVWMFRDAVSKAQDSLPGRPAVLTATNFTLYGLAMFLLDVKSRGGRKPAETLIVTAMLIALLALIGHVCNVPQFYGWRTLTPSTVMGLFTVFAFLSLGAGLLCARPEGGLMELVTSPTASGRMARKLLFAPVLIPMTVGWLARLAREQGFYNAELAGWFIAFANIFFFTFIIWRNARLLREAEQVQQLTAGELRELNSNLERRVEERTRALARATDELRESEERVRLVLNTALDAVIIADGSSRITSWNKEAERMFGWTKAEIIGQRLTETIIPVPLREAHERGMRHFLATKEGLVLNRRIEITGLRRDGTVFPIELAITPIQVADEFIFSAFIRDITERKMAQEEIRKLNEELERRVIERTSQLEQVNKELESFSYSVSHDLRAPLRHINGFVELVRDELDVALKPSARAHLDVIQSAARQMGTLVDDLLNFSRMGRVEMKREGVDMRQLAREVVVHLASETNGRDIQWSIAELPEVSGDRALLKQVLVNLFSNAVKYTRDREQARIQVEYDRREMETEFRVRDNGAGFEMKYVHKLFGVFQRLHTVDEFEGTGIGLANVQRIIVRHGGRTWAEGEPGVGATIYFTVPTVNPETYHA